MANNNPAPWQLDNWTRSLETLLLEIAKAAEENHKRYYIGGGLAVDLSFGGLTRWHEDIDFHPLETDTEWWKDWFGAKGYVIGQEVDMKPYPNAFLVTDNNSDYVADVYPVTFDADGTVSMLEKDGSHSTWPGIFWRTIQQISYMNQQVCLEDYRSVLRQEEEYIRQHGGTLDEKHLHDFRRAGVEPEI